jgi:inward rectifier potassium channel
MGPGPLQKPGTARAREMDGSRRRTEVVGLPHHPLRDAYHNLMRAPWWVTVGLLVGYLFVTNALFALAYMKSGGIAHARPDSFADAFFFSVQTMATIGYGEMVPRTIFANVMVVLEAFTGVAVLAVATGIIFAKFSISGARVFFTRDAVITPMDGVPTLSFRVGNERGNSVVEAQLRVILFREEKTREGHRMYRMHDLPLVRDRSPAFTRAWTVLHRITEQSPLFGMTPESLVELGVEIAVTLTGTDETSVQPIFASHTYFEDEVRFGARHADILDESKGYLRIDFTKFHDVVETEPTAEFPYPRR